MSDDHMMFRLRGYLRVSPCTFRGDFDVTYMRGLRENRIQVVL